MGLGGIGVWPLLLILLIVLLLFGTKKLRNIGGDLGGAIRGFKDAMSDGEKDSAKGAERSEEDRLGHSEGEPTADQAERDTDQERK